MKRNDEESKEQSKGAKVDENALNDERFDTDIEDDILSATHPGFADDDEDDDE